MTISKLALCGLLSLSVAFPAAAADPPDPDHPYRVGGTTKPANSPPVVPAVPGPGDRLTNWAQAATLPWIEAVTVPDLARPDGDARKTALPPVLVLHEERAEFAPTIAFDDGLTLVTLRGDLPAGPAPADYARLAVANADRLDRVRPQLVKADAVKFFEANHKSEVRVGAKGELPVVRQIVLDVSPDLTTPEPNDVLVAPRVSFTAEVRDYPRIISYAHGVFGMAPETSERWVWRAPADDRAPPAAVVSEPDVAEPKAARPMTTALPKGDPAAPRFVLTRPMSGEGVVNTSPN